MFVTMELPMLGSSTCDRCGRQAHTRKGSWFNTQMICGQCQQLEREHPLYEEAKRIENEQCFNGNFNFEGIGLPKDLEEISRIAGDIEVEKQPKFKQPISKEEEKEMISFLTQYRKR